MNKKPQEEKEITVISNESFYCYAHISEKREMHTDISTLFEYEYAEGDSEITDILKYECRPIALTTKDIANIKREKTTSL